MSNTTKNDAPEVYEDVIAFYTDPKHNAKTEPVYNEVAGINILTTKDVWEKHSDEISEWVAARAGRGESTEVDEIADGVAIAMRRHAKSKEGDSTRMCRDGSWSSDAIEVVDRAYEMHLENTEDKAIQRGLLYMFGLSLYMSASPAEPTHAREAVCNHLSKQEFVSAVNSILESGSAALDKTTYTPLECAIDRDLYEGGQLIPISAAEIFRACNLDPQHS